MYNTQTEPKKEERKKQKQKSNQILRVHNRSMEILLFGVCK